MHFAALYKYTQLNSLLLYIAAKDNLFKHFFFTNKFAQELSVFFQCGMVFQALYKFGF